MRLATGMAAGAGGDGGADPHSTPSTHAVLGNVRYHAKELGPYPDLQVERTIDLMRLRSMQDSQDPDFAQRAQMLAGPGSDWQRMGRLYSHVKGSIGFIRDEATASQLDIPNAGDVVEVIIRPVDMARYVDAGIAIGDCDDFSMYLAAMLLACGIPCGFVTVAADSKAPDQYSHVYVVAYPANDAGERSRVACDASHGQFVGWEVPNVFGKIREWQCGGNGDGVGDGFGFIAMIAASVAGVFAAQWLIRKWNWGVAS